MTERQEGGGEGSQLRQDPIVESLVPDPSQLPDLVAFSGFLGKSNRDGYWRLYATLAFDQYVEFSEADVQSVRQLDVSESDFGGSVVWLKRDASVQTVSVSATDAESAFLQGEIASAYGMPSGFVPDIQAGTMITTTHGGNVEGGCLNLSEGPYTPAICVNFSRGYMPERGTGCNFSNPIPTPIGMSTYCPTVTAGGAPVLGATTPYCMLQLTLSGCTRPPPTPIRRRKRS